MLCTVNLLDGTMENVSLDKHAKGRCLLEQICHRLKLTAEMEYFGLKYFNKAGDDAWLNLRNEIRLQMSKANIYRLSLRVKYFVNQSQIIQEKTRNQFFLDAKQNHMQGKYILSRDKIPRFHALLLRTEHGEHALTADTNHPVLMEEWQSSEEFGVLDGLRVEHARLKGVSREEAETIFLAEMEVMTQTLGSQLFHATNSFDERVIIAVCTDAVRIYGNDRTLIDEYHYVTGLYPSTKEKNFFIEIQEDYRCYKVTYKLDNKTLAQNLHRATVEFCTFFTHEAVCDWVRDSKHHNSSLKTLTSLLKHKLDSKYKKPRLYKYDVTRTAQEVYEHAWKQVADEKATLVLARVHRPDKQVFQFGPATPRTPRPDKQVFQFGPATPRTPRPDKQVFQFGPATPRTPRPDKQVFQFGPATPRTPRPDKQVFQFGPGTPRTPRSDIKFFEYGPATPSTPRPIKQDFKFEPGTPRTPRPDKQVFVPGTPTTARPEKQDFDFEQQPIHRISLSTPPRRPPLKLLQQSGDDVASPGKPEETSITEVVSNLRMTPLAKKQKMLFKERFLCKLCKKEYKTCAFLPCGHVVTCWSCAITCDECCECQENIESIKPVKYS